MSFGKNYPRKDEDNLFDKVLSQGQKILQTFVKEYIKKLNKDAIPQTILTLEDIRLQTRTYETSVPIVFGEVLLAGNIIWTSEIRIHHERSGNLVDWWKVLQLPSIFNQLNPKAEDKIEFKIDLAIAICEGVIDDLFGVFVNGVQINTTDYNFRFYYGTQTQKPDPALIKEKGEDIPAFRGICYAVFEDFNLTNFGNKIPKFEFFVKRSNFGTLKSVTNILKSKIKGVNLMPGSGEFVYETLINKLYKNVFWNKQNDMLDGEITYSNNNTNKNQSDAIVALNQMKIDLPNLEWVSVVVTWFSDGLDIASASIFPACELNDAKSGSSPIAWKVGGKNRYQVKAVSRRKDGSLNYGGTVNDSSIISLLKELKERGYKITFYPMLFVDNEEKPWRGRMTGNYRDIQNFFHKKDGYNNFILHYANLVKHLADVFIIGSEMKGLTSIRDENNNFPAVLEFVNLAKSVKSIAPNLLITYASDWSEYHSYEGFYNMDELWASNYIDFIGIDAYFPLTYTQKKPSINEIKLGWTSGEGYDFYFNQKGEKTHYKEQNFAWKNLRWFIQNEHINKDGTKTKFKPKSKKIWFTEFGFPSIDLCTNQPNVFYDPSSKESALPVFSKGIVDIESQKNALLASIEFIEENADIIENAFVWCYDLRPFPFYPQRKDIWSDGDLWQKGHWLNGKLGSNTFDEVVKELCMRSGINEDELQFINCNDLVEGMCIEKSLPLSYYIKSLCDVYFVKISPCDVGIKFKSLINLEQDYIINNSIFKKYKRNSGDLEEGVSFAILPSAISFSFIDRTNKYEPSNITFNVGEESCYFNQNIKITAPIIFTRERAMQIAKNLLGVKRSENFINQICLPFDEIKFGIGDILKLDDLRMFVEQISVDEGFNVLVRGHLVSDLSLFLASNEEQNQMLIKELPTKDASAFIIEVPEQQDFKSDGNKIAIFTSNLKPNSRLFLNDELVGEISNQSIKGKIIAGELKSEVSEFFEDNASFIEVFVQNYKNISFRKSSIYLGSFGGEICYFFNFTSCGEGKFAISRFIRKRYGLIAHSPKDEFLLLSEGVFNFYLPSFIKFGEFKIKYGKDELKIPFNIKESFNKKITIKAKNYKILHNGILFYWIFGANYDFRDFEDSSFNAISVEFTAFDKKVLVRGSEYFVPNLKTPVDFYVKII